MHLLRKCAIETFNISFESTHNMQQYGAKITCAEERKKIMTSHPPPLPVQRLYWEECLKLGLIQDFHREDASSAVNSTECILGGGGGGGGEGGN